ncbi:MAG: AAA family ATPase [Gemmatimonadota bacterium]|nr:AAA family ATPase [Gemmatimonadota bacterium]
MSENPFRIGVHVSGRYFTDRADEVKRLRRAMREPTRLLVLGPRRMGKSSAIAVAAEGARRDAILVVRADLSTASTLVDVANRLLASLSAQREPSWLARLAGSLAPTVSLTMDPVTGTPRIVFGAETRSAPAARQRRSLEEVIAALAGEAAGGGRVAVVLDEFQAIVRLGGEEAEWHLRDLMQRHAEVSFICAGSEVSLVHEMLGEHRAFFRTFELLHVGPVEPEHLARWIDARLGGAGVESDGAGEELVDLAGPRTQDILQVARHVYVRGLARGSVSAADVRPALLDVVREEDHVIRTVWSDLTVNQQNVLRAVASGAEQIFSAAVRSRFGLPTSSTVAAAVAALEKRGILVREADGSVRFDNPFLRRWVEREAGGDVLPVEMPQD